MNFDCIKTSLFGANGGGNKAVLDALDAGLVEFDGYLEVRIVGIMRLRAGGNRLPVLIANSAPPFFAGKIFGGVPGDRCRGLASGMGKLNAGGSTLAVQEVDNAGQGRDLLILPQAQICVGNAPFGHDAGRFHDHQPEAAQREAAKMDEMPVIGEAVDGRILAHRRDHRAVAQGQAAQGDRGKQFRH